MKIFTQMKTYLIILVMLLSSSGLFAQGRTISGKVTDGEDGQPLPGATVSEKGSSNGTVTDLDGNFSLNVQDNATVVISFIGYSSEEVAVGSRTVIDVSMQVDISSLQEVVVVGYGTTRKEDLTGAVAAVETEELMKQASSDVTQMLQGRVAGVSITSDGQPGATPSVRIRGVGTFGSGGASAEPLYVVDGFPIQGGIRDINPNDIESMQVLKDATAGAIYGNRAANGVVIITTKGGRKGQEFSVGFNSYYGVQTIPQRIPVLGRVGYQTLNTEVLANAGQGPVPGNDPTSPDYIDDIDTDWQDAGYKNGSIQNYNLNIAGGTQSSSYFMSLDYIGNEGTLVGTGPDYERYSFRVNSETEIGRLTVGENIYLMRSDENPLLSTVGLSLPGGRPTLVNDLLQAAPTIPVRDPSREGGFGGADGVIHQSITLNVPGLNSLVENSTLVNRILANVYAEIDIIDGLKFKTSLTYDKTSAQDQRFVPEYDLGYFFPNDNATLLMGNRNFASTLIENTLNYEKKIGKHDFEILAGQTFQEFNNRNITTIGTTFEKPYIQNLGNAETVNASDFIDKAALLSFLGRIKYSYDDRYLLTANIRRDGSSRFSEANRYDIFPSIGVAWKVHNDFDLPEFINQLKVRGGYGILGNQNIANYAYQEVVNRGIPYQFGDTRVLGASSTIVRDRGIRWETRLTQSVGIDAMLFNGDLEFTAEYYSNESRDVLLELPIPRSVGSLGAGIITNAGSIRNSGIELSANYNLQLGDLTLNIAPNFYTLKNEVLDIGNLEEIIVAGGRTSVGESIGSQYGWVFDGIFQSADEINTVGPEDPAFDPNKHAFHVPQTAPGDIRFRDLNNDGVINEEDRQNHGSALPTYYYGLNLTAAYKGFDFTVFASGSGGNLINSNLYRGLMNTSSFTNWHEDMLGRWTPENPNNEISRLVLNDPNRNGQDSNRPGWLQSGNYLRINTISLGYNIPASLLKTVNMKSARIYATVQNLHVFSTYKGYNPDFQAGVLSPGFDFGTFPRPTTTMLGVQIKF